MENGKTAGESPCLVLLFNQLTSIKEARKLNMCVNNNFVFFSSLSGSSPFQIEKIVRGVCRIVLSKTHCPNKNAKKVSVEALKKLGEMYSAAAKNYQKAPPTITQFEEAFIKSHELAQQKDEEKRKQQQQQQFATDNTTTTSTSLPTAFGGSNGNTDDMPPLEETFGRGGHHDAYDHTHQTEQASEIDGID